jgi:hypothetical protein
LTKQLALRLFGAAVSSRLGSSLLMRYAFRTPLRHLFDQNGRLYMGRWAVVNEDTLGGRLLERLTGYASIRLHRIMRPDHDPVLHNHPFTYRTFVVRGFYREERQCGAAGYGYAGIDVWNHAGSTTRMSPKQFHRIADAPADGVWTLFFMTRNTGTWGFAVDGKFVPSSVYLLNSERAR